MSETTELQFDHAEPAAAAPAGVRCAACQAEIATSYWQVNGAIACESCHAARVRERATRRPFQFLVAGAYGTAAAALGAGLYYAVSALTGYELGLIGIVVGLGVGFAVKKGSLGRGGWLYQGLATFLTYMAIVSTYVPAIVTALRQQAESAATAAAPAAPADPAPAASTPGAADAGAPAAPAEPPSFAGFAVAVLALLGLAMALPFLAGVENIMGIVIIAISLYEAWKLNRATPFAASGPYDARGAASAPVADVG